MFINLADVKVHLLGIIFIFDALAFGLGSTSILAIRFGLYILMLFWIPKLKILHYNRSIILITLLAILIFVLPFLTSSNLSTSLDSALKTNFSLLLYVYAFLHITCFRKFLILSKYSFIAFVITLMCIAVSNIFQFGELNYKSTAFYFGASGVNYVKNTLLFGILSISYLWEKYRTKKKIFLNILFSAAIFLVIISTKRSALIVLISSLFILTYYNRKNLSKVIIPLVLLISFGSLFFKDSIVERMDARSKRFDVTNQENLEEEWRLVETNIVFENFQKGDWQIKLIGNEIFNEVEAYKLPLMFHNDLAVILGGTGLLGLSIYILFLLSLVFWYKKYLFSVKFAGSKIYKWMFLTFFIGLIIFGISGNFKVFGSSLSIILAGLGAIQSSMMQYYKTDQFQF